MAPSSPPDSPVLSPGDIASLLLLSVLWGGSFFFAEIALVDLPTLSVVWLRVAIAAALLLILVLPRGTLPGDAASWRAFFVMGLLNNAIPFSLIVWAQTLLDSGHAAILNATTPLFAVLVAHVFTRDERLRPHRVVGVLLGLLGVICVVGPHALALDGDALLAQLAILAATLSYAFAGVYGRRFAKLGVPPLGVATGQLCASTTLLVPLVLWVDQPWSLAAPGLPALGAVTAMAVTGTALAYILYFRILASAGATNLMLVTLLVPVSAIALGAIFLGEPIVSMQIVGMLIIAAGLLAMDPRIARRLRSPARR